MGRRIVFFGNCQAEALAHFYREQLAADDDTVDSTFFLNADETQAALLRSADIVVEQIFAGRYDAVSNNVSADCRRIPYPMALAPFYWPYATEPHIHNRLFDFAPHLPAGPWGAEGGDSYLNRMVARGVPTEEAVSTYLTRDIARDTNLDRMTELHLAAQRQRDEIAGIDMAGIIEAYFTKEMLFETRGHPHRRLFAAMAEGVFLRLGIPKAAVEEALGRLPPPWCPGHPITPMHPRLIEHFGLRWIAPEATYFDGWGGLVTFREWCHRYMEFDWNSDLHRGVALAGGAGREDPLPWLERGLARAPASTIGLRTIADVYASRGRQNDAEDALRRMARLDPLGGLPRLAGFLRARQPRRGGGHPARHDRKSPPTTRRISDAGRAVGYP